MPTRKFPAARPASRLSRPRQTLGAAWRACACLLPSLLVFAAAPVAARPEPPTRPGGRQTLHVEIDIQPGVAPNTIDLESAEAVAVAVLSSAGFDAAALDADGVTFAGARATKTDGGEPGTAADVNADGLTDLILYFPPRQTDLNADSTRATLSGTTAAGTTFEGSDAVVCAGRRAQAAAASSAALSVAPASVGAGTAPLALVYFGPRFGLRRLAPLYSFFFSPPAQPSPATQTFSNPSNVKIPGSAFTSGVAGPYPSDIIVSGFPATHRISRVQVTLTNVSHTFPDDLDVLLVGPEGHKFILMSDRGAGTDLVNATLIFDDAASSPLPAATITPGTYRPANEDITENPLPLPAPAGPYQFPAPDGAATLASVFDGTAPNGTWSLYVRDDRSQDIGEIGGGWSITITAASTDTTPPAISTPGDQTAEAAGPEGVAVNYAAPSASDSVDGEVAVSCDHAPGEVFPLGATVVNCSASDASGNEAAASFSVTVRDTTAPTLSGVPEGMTLEATGSAGAVASFDAPEASDLVDGALTPTCDHASGATFPLGTTRVSCSASDSRGNTSTAGFDVTVRDTTGPVISAVPGGQTVEAAGPTGAPVSWAGPTAADAVDGPRPVVCAPPSGSTFPVAESDVSCEAADTRGNSSSVSFRVVVQDTTPPVISGAPGALTVEATGPGGASVNYGSGTTASDLVDGDVGVVFSPPSGSLFGPGTHTVSYGAADSRGNTAAGSFTVTVTASDTTPPVISGVPAGLQAYAAGNSAAAVEYAPTAFDAKDGPVAVACDPPSGQPFPVGATTVTCSATDAAGTRAAQSFTVTVLYDFAGVFQPLDNLPLTNQAKAGSAVPLKFSLRGDQGPAVFEAGFPVSAPSACGSDSLLDAVTETVAAGGSGLSYDPLAGQYVYVWKSEKAWAGGCRQLVLKFRDGRTHRVSFRFVR